MDVQGGQRDAHFSCTNMMRAPSIHISVCYSSFKSAVYIVTRDMQINTYKHHNYIYSCPGLLIVHLVFCFLNYIYQL